MNPICEDDELIGPRMNGKPLRVAPSASEGSIRVDDLADMKRALKACFRRRGWAPGPEGRRNGFLFGKKATTPR
jgi:hypothetical protein